MRGRMTSVNMIFFMGGPQLGELEAGLVAQLWNATVLGGERGGIGCVIATIAIARSTPMLWSYEREPAVEVGTESAASAARPRCAPRPRGSEARRARPRRLRRARDDCAMLPPSPFDLVVQASPPAFASPKSSTSTRPSGRLAGSEPACDPRPVHRLVVPVLTSLG